MKRQNFDTLLLENSKFLTPFSISLTRDEEASKDLVQDTLYRALINKEKYKKGTNLKAWLFTIMRHIFINQYRRQKKFLRVASEVPEDHHLFATKKFAQNNGIMQMNLREIKSAINKLPKIFKNPFEMHYAGYKYKEIAVALGQPLGTVKSRIHFARKILMTNINRT